MEDVVEQVFEISKMIRDHVGGTIEEQEAVRQAIEIQRNMILAGLSGQLPEISAALNEISDTLKV